MPTSFGNTKKSKKSVVTHQHPVAIPQAEPTVGMYGAEPPIYADANALGAVDEEFDPAMDENVDQRVHQAQERISRLRREAEQMEREKQQLEELRQKQQAFMQGRAEMLDRLSRAIALLDRETSDCRRKVEQMLVMRESFADHLESVNHLTPEDWNRSNLSAELTKALNVIDDAKLEYERQMTRLQAFTQAPAPTPAKATAQAPMGLPLTLSKENFRQWAFCGLAFSSPLILAGAIGMVVWLLVR